MSVRNRVGFLAVPSSVVASSIIALLAGCQQNQPTSNTPAARALGERETADSADAITNRPLTAETRFAAGQLAESGGDLGQAVGQYESALKLDPRHAPSLLRLGLIYTAQKQYGKAVPFWERYVEATDKSAAAYSDLGYCLELAGEPAAAEKAYQKGIAADPGSPPCRVNYGLLLARTNRLDAANKQLSVVLTPAEVHYDLASAMEASGDKAGARDEYRKALIVDPAMADAKTRLAALPAD